MPKHKFSAVHRAKQEHTLRLNKCDFIYEEDSLSRMYGRISQTFCSVRQKSAARKIFHPSIGQAMCGEPRDKVDDGEEAKELGLNIADAILDDI